MGEKSGARLRSAELGEEGLKARPKEEFFSVNVQSKSETIHFFRMNRKRRMRMKLKKKKRKRKET